MDGIDVMPRKCAIEKKGGTHFRLKRNFRFELFHVLRTQSELCFGKLDGNFSSIHVRVMHDTCEDYLERMRQAAVYCIFSPSCRCIQDYQSRPLESKWLQ
jgi:hypothetical protein